MTLKVYITLRTIGGSLAAKLSRAHGTAKRGGQQQYSLRSDEAFTAFWRALAGTRGAQGLSAWASDAKLPISRFARM